MAALTVRVLLVAALGLGASACKGSRDAAPVLGAHVDGTPHTNKIIHGLKAAGLSPQGFSAVDPAPYGASFCENGRVNQMDALVCEFTDEGSLAQGRRRLADEWARQGVQTGVAAHSKQTLMAIVDRGHRDPNGKTINQIVLAFKKL